MVILVVDMTKSRYANNRTKNVLVLGHGLIQKIGDPTIYEEKMYSPNFSVENKTFCLSLHYNGDNSYLVVSGKEVTKFEAKGSEIKVHPLLLRNIAVDAFGSGTNKFSFQDDTTLYGNIYDFSVDYDAIAVVDTLDIHKYLIENNNIA